ncbi:MAG: hypothetical protein AAF250_08165 [Pseudomonadota bacterium]
MSEASFASLGPTLLARKGGAKPAMRPQLAPLPEDVADDQLEDLGWNDMGQDDGEGAEVVQLNAAANEDVIEAISPVVKRQQKDLADRVLADAVMDGSEEPDEEDTEGEIAEVEIAEPTPVVTKPRKAKKRVASKSAKKGRRAAFTLRLNAERHLKLRLAATMEGKSAQALVTEALDMFLAEFDDLDALAERMQRS